MASSTFVLSPAGAAAIFILIHLEDGCEHGVLATLLDISLQEMDKLASELQFQCIMHESVTKKLYLSKNVPTKDDVKRYILDACVERSFSSVSLSLAVFFYLTGNYRVFFEKIFFLTEKFDQDNLPIHLFYVYSVFAECFQCIEIQIDDKEFCYYTIRTCIAIQDTIHLYPYNSHKELLTSVKLRELALKIGDQRTTSYLDLQIGAMNLNLRSVNVQSDYFLNMKSAKDKIFYFGDNDIIVRCSPTIIIYYFFNGDYDEVINFFYRILQITYVLKIRFYNRVIFTYAIFSAINKGNYNLAREFIQWGKSDALKANKALNVASFDAYLAYLLILEGRGEEALQIINDILENDNFSVSSYASLIASRLVSYLHYMQGNLQKSYASFVSLVVNRPCAIFHSNYLSFYFVLDLLGAYKRAGFPTITGFETEKELEFALNGPVKLGQGIAHRNVAELLAHEKGWDNAEVREHLEKSLSILQAIQVPLYMVSTYWDLSRHYHAGGDTKYSSKMLEAAWDNYKIFSQPFWPKDLPMPATLGVTGHSLPARNSFASFCIKLLKSRSVFTNFKSIKSFFYELLSMLLSTMEMVTGEVFCIAPEGQKSVAYINYGEMFHRGTTKSVYRGELVSDMLNNRASALYAGGKHIASGLSELVNMPDSTPLSLCLFYPYDDKVSYLFVLHGTLKVCKANLYPELLDILDNFIRPEIESFLQNASAETASIELSPDSSLLEAQEIQYCSKAMSKLVEQIDSLADKSVSVLILGESGVGKELVARRLHSRSQLQGEFVPVNISNIPNDLFESELFGYERGSFTGALQKKTGLFELADNGTLFLDEIGDAPYTLQVKLLRVIQEKEFMRVGGIRKIHSNFRLISATNKNLSKAITDGTFREDFFYRLNAVTLLVPSLRERQEDIPYLATMFRKHYARLHKLPDREFPETLMQQLINFEWPGNVRQLRHVVENYCLLSTGSGADFSASLWQVGQKNVQAEHLPEAVKNIEKEVGVGSSLFTGLPTLKQLEEKYFEHVYAQCGGVVGGKGGVSAVLGISRATSYAWIERLGLNRMYKKTVTRLP